MSSPGPLKEARTGLWWWKATIHRVVYKYRICWICHLKCLQCTGPSHCNALWMCLTVVQQSIMDKCVWPGNGICWNLPSSALIELYCSFLEVRLGACAVSNIFRKIWKYFCFGAKFEPLNILCIKFLKVIVIYVKDNELTSTFFFRFGFSCSTFATDFCRHSCFCSSFSSCFQFKSCSAASSNTCHSCSRHGQHSHWPRWWRGPQTPRAGKISQIPLSLTIVRLEECGMQKTCEAHKIRNAAETLHSTMYTESCFSPFFFFFFGK